MVQLTEVEDEHFVQNQAGPADDDDEYTDTDSQISEESDFDADAETIGDRIYALRDMIPSTTRAWIAHRASQGGYWAKSLAVFSGKAAYFICSSALLIGVPWALAWAEDQNIAALEQEHRMREMGGEMLVAGGEEGVADRVGAALGQEPNARAQAQPAL